jgi:acetyl-CoA C-acetyltransferase
MGMVPMGSNVTFAVDAELPVYGEGWAARYADQEISQFRGAQLICEKWSFKRADLERFALESHRRAARAIDEGRFEAEIEPIAGVTRDEGVRRDTSLEKMAGLEPLRPGWEITAAVSSQISVGASALLVASEEAVRRHNLAARARVVSLAVVGDDPVFMLTGPIPATRAALKRSGLGIDDIDIFEVNEAFAPVVLAWQEETGASPDKTNVNGGAIALGHPLGGTGAILATKLLHELERSGGRYGLQTMCEGGGQANATIIERLG